MSSVITDPPNALFTATLMIGFIAGAGIVVRNSIILVDFIELRLLEGLPLEQAVVDAGAVRFRPMALTAAAMIVGAGVILFDPIFQGLAISLMAGEVASLLLSRMAVPVLYYMAKRQERTEPVAHASDAADRCELAAILLWRRYWAGGTSNARLKARLNAASDSYPTSAAISATPLGVDVNACAARRSRQPVKYAMGGTAR